MFLAASEARKSVVPTSSSMEMKAFLGMGSSMILLITSSSEIPCDLFCLVLFIRYVWGEGVRVSCWAGGQVRADDK
jgi:hypothetical protein